MDLKQFIRDIPDYPKEGILFKDITPLIANPQAFQSAIDQLADRYKDSNVDTIVAAEARGFVFGAPLALAMGTAFVPVRKPGKLPYRTHSHTYDLEYGTDTLEIHVDALTEGHNVLIIDDLLATGGTVEACCKLIKQFGANIIGCGFVVELGFLGGAEKLAEYDPYSLITY